jgi:hypothetical protein
MKTLRTKKWSVAARLLPLIFLCAGSPSARAESEFAVRLAPAAVFPAGESNFDGGFGLNAVLDWSFLSPADSGKLRMGIAAGGGMSSLSAAGSPFSITEGFAGPFVQWRALDRLSLRAFLSGGLYRYGYEQAAGSLSRFGGGASAAFHVSPAFSLFAEMAYTRYEFTKSNPIHVMSAGAGLRLSVSEFLSSPARVKVEETGRRPVFPVSFAWYEENPLMSVRVTNGEPNAVHDLRLRFLIERYMNEPSLFASLPELAPGETVELPVTALLTEAMLDLTENTAAAARLLLDYRSLGSARHADFPVRLGVHHRNAMNWDDDRRAASFVSPKDPAARLFARFTASVVEYALRPAGEIPLNAQYALALFETLNLYGMSYVIDPASSYAAMTEEAGSIDSLNYPCETLFYRGGDCDDLSILFCSMLEALDIPAAFITAPGHIYAAFDIGDGQEWPQGKQRGVIEAEGRLWLPVEITLPGAGFWEAVSAGARQWKSAGSRARLYPIREAWKVYPSVTVPEAGRRSPVLPEEARILRAFHSEAGKSGAPGKTGK